MTAPTKPEQLADLSSILNITSAASFAELHTSLENEVRRTKTRIAIACQESTPFFLRYASTVKGLRDLLPTINANTRALRQDTTDALHVLRSCSPTKRSDEITKIVNWRKELESLLDAPYVIDNLLQEGRLLEASKAFVKLGKLRSSITGSAALENVWLELSKRNLDDLRKELVLYVAHCEDKPVQEIKEIMDMCLEFEVTSNAPLFFVSTRLEHLTSIQYCAEAVRSCLSQFDIIFGEEKRDTFSSAIVNYMGKILRDTITRVKKECSAETLASWLDSWPFQDLAEVGMDLELLMTSLVEHRVLELFAGKLAHAVLLLPESEELVKSSFEVESVKIATIDIGNVGSADTSQHAFINACMEAFECLSDFATATMLEPSVRILLASIEAATARYNSGELKTRVSTLLRAVLLRGVYRDLWHENSKWRELMLKLATGDTIE